MDEDQPNHLMREGANLQLPDILPKRKCFNIYREKMSVNILRALYDLEGGRIITIDIVWN